MSGPANPSEQNSLRLRIKVGSDKPVRKNYEIYSGLGLLLSPSSSTGNDSEDIVGSTIESPGCVLRSKGKLSKVSVTVKADKEAQKNIVPVKKGETNGECVKDELFSLDFTSKESRESVKRVQMSNNEETRPMTVAKRLSLDSKRSSKGSTALSVCKTEPDVSKHTTVHSEKKQGIEELPSKRKNKLTGVQSIGISSLGAIKDKSAMQTEVALAEAASHDNWVACDQCNAWRLLPIGITADNLPENWWCSKSTWLPGKNYCDVSEDETTQAVREMNFKISSQNHVIGDTYHANSNANSE
ncbi:cullin, conserved site-containing protein [Tanacetum coccineum]|uniref:Cullin, conserved site-containing protein n=1 Tax=Tanacetum coccineum TaxID=301880 RepID=A0ABQ4YST2_9ASTR